MSVKQDRTGVRTATDLERKYNFGKTFAEMLGLINENREKVDSAESSLRSEIKEQSTSIMRDTAQIVAQAEQRLSSDIKEVESAVELKMDAESVNIVVDQRISEGVDRVETRTGYRFDEEGLSITRYGDEISNVIDNTGMYVKRFGDDILSANNNGVDAVNLHAKTYLIVGSGDGRSRFEDYGIDRTGCFWIG